MSEDGYSVGLTADSRVVKMAVASAVKLVAWRAER